MDTLAHWHNQIAHGMRISTEELFEANCLAYRKIPIEEEHHFRSYFQIVLPKTYVRRNGLYSLLRTLPLVNYIYIL